MNYGKPLATRTGIRALIGAMCFGWTSLAAFSQVLINAGYKTDFEVPATATTYTWSDATDTGIWSVGFGSYSGATFNNTAAYDPALLSGAGAYGFSTRYFGNDTNHTIFPGTSRSSYSAIIRWEAAEDSVVTIRGILNKPSSTGDGIDYYIYQVDGGTGTASLLFSRLTLTSGFSNFGSEGSATLTGVSLDAGDYIAFIVSPRSTNLNVGDQVNFSQDLRITGTAVPEPSTLVLLGAGIGGIYFVRRRGRKS